MIYTKKQILTKLKSVLDEDDFGHNFSIDLDEMAKYLLKLQKLGAFIILDKTSYCEVFLLMPIDNYCLNYTKSFQILKYILVNKLIPVPTTNVYNNEILELCWRG